MRYVLKMKLRRGKMLQHIYDITFELKHYRHIKVLSSHYP